MKYFWILALCTLAGCGEQKAKKETPSPTNNIVEPPKTNTTMEAQSNDAPNSAYFKGVGTEPFWSLQISPEKISFSRMEEADFNSPHVEPIQVADANIKRYRAETESGSIDITISQGECSDQMSDNIYDYRVEISFRLGGDTKAQTFKGCGNYIADYRLHDIWSLDKIGEETVSASDFKKEKPYIEINAEEKTFMGFAGCNRMNGQIFTERDRIRFTAAVTRMACPPGNREADFLKGLNATTQYTLSDGQLVLSNPNGVQLVFRKVD